LIASAAELALRSEFHVKKMPYVQVAENRRRCEFVYTLQQLFTLAFIAVGSYGIRFGEQQQVCPFFNSVRWNLVS